MQQVRKIFSGAGGMVALLEILKSWIQILIQLPMNLTPMFHQMRNTLFFHHLEGRMIKVAVTYT